MRAHASALLLFSALAAAQGVPTVPVDFSACLAELRTEAQRQGITNDTFDVAMARVEPDPTVIEAMSNQPEFSTPVWQYLAGLVDERRIADGRAQLKQWTTTLARAEKEFGVDRHVIVAVWGVESNYGKHDGAPAPGALAGHGLVLRQPQGVLPRRAHRGAEDPRQRRHRGRLPQGLVGGGLRPDAVHALHLPAHGGRFRRRRASATSWARCPMRSAPPRTTSSWPAGSAAAVGLRGEDPGTLRGSLGAAHEALRGRVAQAWASGASTASR